MDKKTKERIEKRKNEQKNGRRMDRQMDGLTDDEQRDIETNGQISRQADRSMHGHNTGVDPLLSPSTKERCESLTLNARPSNNTKLNNFLMIV
jgi:hypothetical protein